MGRQVTPFLLRKWKLWLRAHWHFHEFLKILQHTIFTVSLSKIFAFVFSEFSQPFPCINICQYLYLCKVVASLCQFVIDLLIGDITDKSTDMRTANMFRNSQKMSDRKHIYWVWKDQNSCATRIWFFYDCWWKYTLVFY